MKYKIADRILDALDNAPQGVLRGEIDVDGQIATIQWLASAVGMSDGYVRSTVVDLYRRGLVHIFDGFDPNVGARRLYVIGVPA